MTSITVKSADLLVWSQYLEQVPKKTKAAIARAMNDYGAGVADGTAEAIAGITGLNQHELRSLIEIREASPNNLRWEMDATAIKPPPPDWERPWEKRNTGKFEKETLVNIITMGDHITCEACEEAAENSPYTMDEVNQLAAKWKHWEPPAGVVGVRTNLIHPNCRCSIEPFEAQRKMPVSFSGKGAPRELLSARQLGIKIAGELSIVMKVKR